VLIDVSLSLVHLLSLAWSLSHSLSHSVSLSHTHTHTHTHTCFLFLSRSLSLSLFLALARSLSLTHTHTHARVNTRTHTHIDSLVSSLAYLAGDFVGLYSFISHAKGPAHRKFNCVVTCFFIDTSDELIDYILTIDGLLEEVYISM